MNLTNIGGTATFIDAQGIGTIQDGENEPAINFSASFFSLTEGDASVTMTAQVDIQSNLTITVGYTISGDASGSGTDYGDLVAASITIAPKTSSQIKSFTIAEDGFKYKDENNN